MRSAWIGTRKKIFMNFAHGCTRIMMCSPNWLGPFTAPTAAMTVSKLLALLFGVQMHG
jgi:hypothetical protein